MARAAAGNLVIGEAAAGSLNPAVLGVSTKISPFGLNRIISNRF